jgi:hypothetical protein
LNRPEESVVALRFSPVSWLVIVTEAPGTAAPLASLTWPTIALVVSPWAKLASGARSDPANTAIHRVVRSLILISGRLVATTRILNLA